MSIYYSSNYCIIYRHTMKRIMGEIVRIYELCIVRKISSSFFIINKDSTFYSDKDRQRMQRNVRVRHLIPKYQTSYIHKKVVRILIPMYSMECILNFDLYLKSMFDPSDNIFLPMVDFYILQE